ncbi:MAG: hypothetical protein GWO86_03905 [Planctomycetes bacterium]|nr:hypothetical protein [Planctomycetota bacterium]
MWLLILAVALYLLCAVLLVVEVFVPSFGLITICAMGAMAGGLAIFFNYSPAAGWIGVIVAVVMIPTVLVTAYKMFPKTRFGRNVSLAGPNRAKGDAIPDTEQLEQMLGMAGRVITPLRPVGMCDFSGQRLECVAESSYVDKGRIVEIIKVEGTQLTVRPKEQTS